MGTHSDRSAVRAEGLVKTFGSTRALDGVDLEIPAGKVLGLLGPNGAGKTTTVRILTTLLRPDSGRRLGGRTRRAGRPGGGPPRDRPVRPVRGGRREPDRLREPLHGRQALRLQAGRRPAPGPPNCSGDFRLRDAADRPAKTYSGGMRRRLDLAGALVARASRRRPGRADHRPRPARAGVDTWEVIGNLVSDGATVLLTTQYLEEADQLADTIAVIDKGKLIAEGTADQLKAQTGGERLELVVVGRGRTRAWPGRCWPTSARTNRRWTSRPGGSACWSTPARRR